MNYKARSLLGLSHAGVFFLARTHRHTQAQWHNTNPWKCLGDRVDSHLEFHYITPTCKFACNCKFLCFCKRLLDVLHTIQPPFKKLIQSSSSPSTSRHTVAPPQCLLQMRGLPFGAIGGRLKLCPHARQAFLAFVAHALILPSSVPNRRKQRLLPRVPHPDTRNRRSFSLVSGHKTRVKLLRLIIAVGPG